MPCERVRKYLEIKKTVNDLHALLDDLILENDEFEQAGRAERDKQNPREQQLNAAEVTILQVASSRMRLF